LEKSPSVPKKGSTDSEKAPIAPENFPEAADKFLPFWKGFRKEGERGFLTTA
jgi:hypothetical protein